MRAALLGGSALVLAACAAPEPTRPPSPSPMPVATASPMTISGRDWHLTQHDGQSSLAFGVAETDDVNLALTCDDGSGRVQLFRDAPDGTPPEFHLESGGETERFAAASEPSMLSDGQVLSAEASATEPVLRRFRSVGWLALWTGDGREAYAPHPGSEAGVERFFAACG